MNVASSFKVESELMIFVSKILNGNQIGVFSESFTFLSSKITLIMPDPSFGPTVPPLHTHNPLKKDPRI